MRKLTILCILFFSSLCFSQLPQQFRQKPLLGSKINWNHPLSKNLKLVLLFNEGGGNYVNDYSNNGWFGRPGTSTGSFIWVTTQVGSAIDVQNTDASSIDLRSINNTDVLVVDSQPISIEMLVNIDAHGTADTFFSLAGVSTDGWIWLLDGGASREFTWGSLNVSASFGRHDLTDFSLFPIDSWEHMVLVMPDPTDFVASGGHRLYRNGREIGVESVAPGWSAGTQNQIGHQDDGFPIDGQFSIARIWQRELTPLDVWSLYVNPYAMFEQSLWGRLLAAAAEAAARRRLINWF